MMTAFRNSLTWKDTVEYGVWCFSFLILGKTMNGQGFVEAIKAYYDANEPRTKEICEAIENHLVNINVRADGYTQYSIK